MRDEIYAWYVVHAEVDFADHLCWPGAPGVAGTTELSLEGLVRQVSVRPNLVFGGRFVANLAIKRRMRGDRLAPGNSVMTRRAFLNNAWRRRVVGVVTARAGSYRVMALFDDLGEAGRPRRQVAVASETRFPPGWHVRLDLHGIGRMVAGRPMAGFATHGPVKGLVLLFDLVRVAHRTGLPARIPRLQCCIDGHRVRAIMAQVTEGFRNKSLPEEEDSNTDGQKDDAELDYLGRELAVVTRGTPFPDSCSQGCDWSQQ